MRDFLEESVAVLVRSTKTQVALAAGFFFFGLFMIVGASFSSSLELHGALAPLTGALREKIIRHYDKAAWISLVSFSLLAMKCYRADRKRLLEM
jgi:hypothetical protein